MPNNKPVKSVVAHQGEVSILIYKAAVCFFLIKIPKFYLISCPQNGSVGYLLILILHSGI